MHSFSGLNLCFESLDGIVKHNGPIGDNNKMIKVFGMKIYLWEK